VFQISHLLTGSALHCHFSSCFR